MEVKIWEKNMVGKFVNNFSFNKVHLKRNCVEELFLIKAAFFMNFVFIKQPGFRFFDPASIHHEKRNKVFLNIFIFYLKNKRMVKLVSQMKL